MRDGVAGGQVSFSLLDLPFQVETVHELFGIDLVRHVAHHVQDVLLLHCTPPPSWIAASILLAPQSTESEPGKGSTFRITLPRDIRSEAAR
jgi:hypothetical protein